MLIELGLFITMIIVSLVVLIAFLMWWKRQRHSELVDFIAQLVAAAEQTLPTGGGTAKFTWVLEQIQKRFPSVDVDLARTLIEAAVYRQQSVKPPAKAMPSPRMSGYDHR